MKKKTVAILMTCVLVLGGVIGGTLAWLTDETAPVVNTFTDSNINITLTETGITDSDRENDYKMIPGWTITKDPRVAVIDTPKPSEDCYLFVKIDESLGSWSKYATGENPKTFKNFIKYEMADGWTLLSGKTGVYYRVVKKSDSTKEFAVIKNDQVTVSESITKTMMEEIDGFNNNGEVIDTEIKPTLTFKAYAVQYYKNNNTGGGENQDSTGTYFAPDKAWEQAESLE